MLIVHVANDSVSLIPEVKLVHSMDEDRDVPGQRIAQQHLRWLDTLYPQEYVEITTGDYVNPRCHASCATYDANCCLYIVKAEIWQNCKEMVLEADRKWRVERMQCLQLVG